MYNIVQLNEKSLTDLQAIANELGISKPESLSKEDLVYRILDEQAISNANKIVAKDKQKEEKTKRKRVTVTNGKLNKVFSANKEGTISREEQPISVVQEKMVSEKKAEQPAKVEAEKTVEEPVEKPAKVQTKASKPAKKQTVTGLKPTSDDQQVEVPAIVVSADSTEGTQTKRKGRSRKAPDVEKVLERRTPR